MGCCMHVFLVYYNSISFTQHCSTPNRVDPFRAVAIDTMMGGEYIHIYVLPDFFCTHTWFQMKSVGPKKIYKNLPPIIALVSVLDL